MIWVLGGLIGVGGSQNLQVLMLSRVILVPRLKPTAVVSLELVKFYFPNRITPELPHGSVHGN